MVQTVKPNFCFEKAKFFPAFIVHPMTFSSFYLLYLIPLSI
ncbi:hypothetical protein SR187_7410 [Streptococcus ruminantium]|uniref:Uncharacterized protein n=1 Tax=Streptococcus ruminantium TaxID=1917441 RepID=A0A2Z5TRX3_9STRE|nr:hypothetical protein SR187_7410 [Streptococcus ruminantium]